MGFAVALCFVMRLQPTFCTLTHSNLFLRVKNSDLPSRTLGTNQNIPPKGTYYLSEAKQKTSSEKQINHVDA